MTFLLLITLSLLFVYALYFAAQTARIQSSPKDFLDGGMTLPGWSVMFILPAIGVAALGVERHFLLVANYGLQASHVAVGLITVAIAAVMLWNRLWVATRLAGLCTPGEAIGRYYNSIALRVIFMGLCILFALPYSANLLSQAALLLQQATSGTIPREMGVWIFAVSMAIPAIIGGWRAVVLVLAMEALLIAILIPGITLFGEIVLTGDIFPTQPMPVEDGVFWDRIPGVLQGYAGFGKSVPVGGIFTAVAISSTGISLVGIVLSPATLYLGQTTLKGNAFGIGAVWLTSGLAAGIMLLVVPVLAARMPAGLLSHAESLAAVVPLAGVSVILLGVMGALFAISFFVTGGALLVFRELVHTYLYPNLTDKGQRLGARISLGFGFFLLGLMAAFMPYVSAVFASVALPLALQLLPAMVGFTFMRWISRGAVLAGIALGSLLVAFTELLGLIIFEGLFVDLPLGRWPLTIHSAIKRYLPAVKGPTERAEVSVARSGLLGLRYCGVLSRAALKFLVTADPRRAVTLGLANVVLVASYSVGFGRVQEVSGKPIRLGMPWATRSPEWISSGLSRVVNRVSHTDTSQSAQSSVRLLLPDLESKQPAVKSGHGKRRYD